MRTTWTSTLRYLLAICCTSMLVACGSGNSENTTMPQPTATSAEGLWMGTTPTGRTINALVLDDDSYWVFYTTIGNPTVLAGLIQGTGTSHLGSFTSSNTRDFNLEGAGILAATMSGSYVQRNSFNETIAYLTGDTGGFTTTYDTDYELVPDMNLVAGNYFGLRADNQTVSVTLDPDGTLSGTSTDGCTFVGSFSPRGKGNVFNVTANSEVASVAMERIRLAGLRFLYKAAAQRLYTAGLNGNRTNGFMFIGTRR